MFERLRRIPGPGTETGLPVKETSVALVLGGFVTAGTMVYVASKELARVAGPVLSPFEARAGDAVQNFKQKISGDQ